MQKFHLKLDESESESVELSGCKVTAKHLSLGRFTGSTIDLEPLQSMISEIKGEETREQELTHCQARFAVGTVRLQAAFEKTEGQGKRRKSERKKQCRIRPHFVA